MHMTAHLPGLVQLRHITTDVIELVLWAETY